MKNKYKLLLVIIIMIFSANFNNLFGQATHVNNIRAGTGDFLGWDTQGTPGSLEIRNDFTNNINFFTTGAVNPWMTILGNNNANLDNGYVGIHTTTPQMPLTIFGDANNPIANGFAKGLYLQNHAVICWSDEGFGNNLIMGHPTTNPAGEFGCVLTPNLTNNGPVNAVYRIIGTPHTVIPPFTPPNAGDFEFLNPVATPHNVFMDGSLGIGLDINVNPLYTPGNRIEINTTAPLAFPAFIAANAITGANTANGFGAATGFSGLRFTDLRASSVPYPSNPGLGLLSIDANGDIIYVPDRGVGAECGTSFF